MGQQYMPYYVQEKFGRSLFSEMDDEMAAYHHKIKNVVDYDTRIREKVVSVKYGIYSSNTTPEAFLEPIEPVFEYLIGAGYINPAWTKGTYLDYAHKVNNHQIKLVNLVINGIEWKEIYMSYMQTIAEMHFQFIRAPTDDFPEYYWDGWVYIENDRTYRKLKNHPIYIHRYRNWML
jgi:hypothetical protein